METSYPVSRRYQRILGQLQQHPLYRAIRTQQQLRLFMQYHVFAVWDFMSVVKSLQAQFSPSHIPWMPSEYPQYVRFINELVMEEESDVTLGVQPSNGHCSHFESYLMAMSEIGAETDTINHFLHRLRTDGLYSALTLPQLPDACRQFMLFTFSVLEKNKSHLTASLLAFGRESVLPDLFRVLGQQLVINPIQTPILNAYLERHISIDGDNHGPMSIQMVNDLCGNDSLKHAQVMDIAEQSLLIRHKLWDGIYQAVKEKGEKENEQQHKLAI